MRGLMMDYPLTIPAIVRRAQALFRHRPVSGRRPDRRITRTTLGEVLDRTRRLGVALRALGVRPGQRGNAVAWASQEHLEAYLAVPSIGAVLHTLNLRLHHDDLAYIVNDAQDRVLILDESLLPLLGQFRSRTAIEHVIVIPSDRDDVRLKPATTGGEDIRVMPDATGGEDVASGFSRTIERLDGFIDYEALLASADPAAFVEAPLTEEDAAAMCYTSGTTGRPKGVLYSHRAIVLHSLAQGLVDTIGIGERDSVLPIVPMFHVNAWGLPFTTTLFGAGIVLPGPYLDPASVLDLIVQEKVTVTAGVPTVWLGMLGELDKAPGAHDVSALRAIVIGGAAAPASLIRGYRDRHNLNVVHAWGMTEITPLGTLCNLPPSLDAAPLDEQCRYRARQGTPLPFVEIRARADGRDVPWDGQTMGELETRGPWVARQYYNVDGPDDRFTDDGWFRTGDIVTIDANGCIEIADRAKDLVKSGGEWISSVALENALMAHPAVAEAAVIAVPHPKWDERPVAVVVLRRGQAATADELRTFLAPNFASWWLPDAIEFASEIPRTSVGKFKKSVLREQYRERFAGI
jgi:fatty-acyl-CoA synthase